MERLRGQRYPGTARESDVAARESEYTFGMTRASATSSFRPGSLIVLAILLLGIAAATVAIWYQRMQTRRCLDFYGAEAAWRVVKAPRVELWRLAPTGRPGRLMATNRHDVTVAKGIVHLRRGLVEDASFRWDVAGPVGRLPEDAWHYALVFSDPAIDGRTTLVVNLEAAESETQGWLAVQGRPGRAALGRLGSGLAGWIMTTISNDTSRESR